MRLFAIVFVVLVAQTAAAGTFVGTNNATIKVSETLDGTTSTATKTAPVSVTLATDYSTMNWSMSWNLNLVMTGGPTQSFETDLIAAGTMSSRRCTSGSQCLTSNTPSPLTFPDANGKSGAGSYILAGSASWTLTDRIVTSSRTRSSATKNIATGGPNTTSPNPTVNSVSNHYLTVSNYPTSITLTPGFSGTDMYQDLGSLVWSYGSGYVDFGTWTNGSNDTVDVSFSIMPTTFTLFEQPAGDMTSNGVVDAGDYVLWRKGAGPLAPFLSSYDVWRKNFGNPSGGGLGADTVPEPSSIVLLAVIAAAIGFYRSR